MIFERQEKHMDEEFPSEVQAVFRAYREALPDSHGSPEFMPQLWARIENERKVQFSFRRLTRALAPVSAALCMLFAVTLWTPLNTQQNSRKPVSTYVEVLDAGSTIDDDLGADATAI